MVKYKYSYYTLLFPYREKNQTDTALNPARVAASTTDSAMSVVISVLPVT